MPDRQSAHKIETLQGVLVPAPSDHEAARKTASSSHNRSRSKQGRVLSRVQTCCLNGWCKVLLIVSSCCLPFALSSCGGSIIVNGASTGALVVSPNSVAFGSVQIGQAATTTVALLNNGSAPVQIAQLNLSGQHFSLVGSSSLPVTVAAGATYTLNVQFNPATAGTATGQLTIASDSATAATPVITLSGTGTTGTGTAALSALYCSSGAITGPGTDACTVTLTASAPSDGLTVNLSSSSSALTVPSTVTVPANATSAGFTATVAAVAAAQAVTMTASAGSVFKSFSLQLNAAVPALSINATSVAFGDVVVNTTATPQPVTLTSTGTVPVTISAAAVTGAGFAISGATFPMTLNPGQQATLSVEFDPTAVGAATGQLTITSNSSTNGTAVISLSGTGTTGTGSAALSALYCSSGTMTGSGSDACTVMLTAAAPSGGLSVSLSGSSSAVTVPSTVTVPANATSVGFTATVASVATAQAVTITASAGGLSRTFALQLNAAVPALSINMTSLAFGSVVLNTAATPQPVTLTSTGTAPVTVSAVAVTDAGFAILRSTFPVTLNPGQQATLSVVFNPTAVGAATGQLTITSNSSTNRTAVVSLSGIGTAAPAALSALYCSSGTMTGSGTDACTVTLTAAAPSGGLSVSLSSSSSAVTVPSTVTVPANATSAGFTATLASVATAQAATMTASAGSVFKSFPLQLNAAILALSINATSVAFGDVVVNTPATQSVTLTSTGTVPVTVNGATLMGVGFTLSGAAFPDTLNPGQAGTLNIVFDPTAAGVATGQLTITSNSSTNGTAVIGLSGTGTAPPQAVVVAVTPTTASTTAGANQQFAASVTGTSNTAVTWAVLGVGCTGVTCGTISSTGLYTAPAIAPSPSTVTITATSVTDPSKSASAGVTIMPLAGTTYYLAPASVGGNDSNSGLSPSAPWLTPNHNGLVCNVDTIQAAASTAYSQWSFTSGEWGAVSCPGGNGVVWLKCITFDACKITIPSSTGTAGMGVSASYWGVQGWEASTIASDTYGTCFIALPNPASPVEIHHIIFANNIANGCAQGGFNSVNNGSVGVDYLAIIGNIAYNSVQGSGSCSSGLSIYEPVQSDSLPGTHIYIAGNFSYGNIDGNPCAGGTPTDGNGFIADTWSGLSYRAQAVVDNNLFLFNGGRGAFVYSTAAPVYIRQNTAFGNNIDQNQTNRQFECGEISLTNATNAQVYRNIAETNATTGCGSITLYSYFVGNSAVPDVIYQDVGYSAAGNVSGQTGSTGFSFGPNNLFSMDPQFANPVEPPAPSCDSSSSVSACMAQVIANFTPMNAAAKGYGYQPPSSTSVYDPLFPQWLCNVNLTSGLVTMGCQTAR